ncbi:hypothetical protein Tco_0970937 [Tanacetum coccineum]
MEKKAMSHEEVAEKESDMTEVLIQNLQHLGLKTSKKKTLRDHLPSIKRYMDDGSEEIIQNFKASDLHLGEWKEVMDACPKRTGAGWTTIYTQMRQRLDAFYKAKANFELDLSNHYKNKILSSN